MDTPTTALSRVEAVLQAADEYMYVHQIARAAEIDEKETKKVLSTLFSMGQIDQIPSVNRWGPRYAWLSTKPVAVEPPVIPEEDLVSGMVTVAESEPSAESEGLPMLGGRAAAFVEAASRFAESMPRVLSDTLGGAEIEPTLTEQLATFYGAHYQQEPARYAVAVPRRPLRIVKTRARAEALAMAAVRRGAKSAEVFALTAVGRARRDAVFVETE